MSGAQASSARLAEAASRFDLGLARGHIADLMAPSGTRYHVDLGVTACSGWLLLIGSHLLGIGVPGVLIWVPGVWLLYRSALFVHEVVHLRSHLRQRFAPFWNLLVGVPLLIPTFLYECHAEHHSRRTYGSVLDAEYLPYARMPRRALLTLLLASPVVALFGPIRFGLVAPLSWVLPPVREWSWRLASAIKLDVRYQGRPPLPGRQTRSWLRQEVLCALVVWSVGAAVLAGLLPPTWPLLWYLSVTVMVLLNSVRLLAAHRYVGFGGDASLVAQMVDSVNVARRPVLNAFWGPVGLRLHALHHLFPSLPYHAYPEAHRRLCDALPADSAYRLTEEPGLVMALVRLWRFPRPQTHPNGGGA